MGVHGTFCQLCGMPTGHDHYVPTGGGMLKIYRGAKGPGGGHDWEEGEEPFPFGPEHDWLKDAVVLPWDEERVLRGPIEDGAIDDPQGGPSVMVFAGDDDGIALHHACWELQGSPQSTEPAVRSFETHLWALVEGYHGQLFDFAGLAEDGKAWMLADPRTSERSRARIDALLEVAPHEVTDPPTTMEGILAVDRDWSCMAVHDRDSDGRRGLVRARMYAIEAVPKDGFGWLVRVTHHYGGDGLPGAAMADLEAFECDLKAAVERDAAAVFTVAGIGQGRAEYLVYARDADATCAAVEALPTAQGMELEWLRDPDWSDAPALIRSLA